jgi:hypothetical protein
VIQARKRLCRIALKELGDSGIDVAQFLGGTMSSVNRPGVFPEHRPQGFSQCTIEPTPIRGS